MKIIIDTMGGDNAPLEIVKGAVNAALEFNVGIVLVGREEVIYKTAEECGLTLDNPNFEIINANETIEMTDHALSVRTKKNSSMSIALRLLSEGYGDALVSAGNTGALYAGSSLIVYRIKGFRKAAIATIIPFDRPVLLIDSGANTVVTEENLVQFAFMGSIYMKNIYGIESPAVGLLNNGTEPTKGTELLQKTHALLEADESINFVGNVEGKEVPFGECDVLVTDGFTGNVLLKTVEGFGSYMMGKLKEMYLSNIVSKLSSVAVKSGLKKLKGDFDASEHGGAPILGISKPVIKAHGSSDAKAIKNAVRQAISYISTGIIVEIVREYAAREAKAAAAPEVDKNPANGNG